MTLTPKEYAFYPSEADARYGLLFCVDEEGRHVTLRGDADLVRLARDAEPHDNAARDIGGLWERADGWPDEWRVTPRWRPHSQGEGN